MDFAIQKLSAPYEFRGEIVLATVPAKGSAKIGLNSILLMVWKIEPQVILQVGIERS